MYHIQKYFAIALTMLLCLDLGAREKLTKETILNHAEELKALVNDRCWPGFSAPEYATHLNYHEDGDFRMYLSIDGRDAEAVIECSSPEITFAAQPGIKTLDQWYAMVLHECFHGFQVKHEVFRDMMMTSSNWRTTMTGIRLCLLTKRPSSKLHMLRTTLSQCGGTYANILRPGR